LKSLSSLHRIKVLGRELQVRSTAAPERVRQIEEYVLCRVEEIEVSSRSRDPLVIAIMALLNVTESFLELSSEHAKCTTEENESLSRLLKLIDEAME
jgi:cell division protein ZapA (FtsZ GTPase activity inhibitor)